MKVKSLMIENFKCFDRLKIDFKPITILAGGNACGKSSVIQMLRYLQRIDNDKSRVSTSIDQFDYGAANSIIYENSSNNSFIRFSSLSFIPNETSSDTLEPKSCLFTSCITKNPFLVNTFLFILCVSTITFPRYFSNPIKDEINVVFPTPLFPITPTMLCFSMFKRGM